MEVASRVLQLGLGLAAVAAMQAAVLGAGWSDDFNDGNATDGNPVTWSVDPPGAGYFTGTYDASSGDYRLSQPTGLFAQHISWVDSATFDATYVRTQGVVEPGAGPDEDEGNLALLARMNPATLDAYILYFDTDFNLGVLILQQGQTAEDESVEIPFNAATEVTLEFHVVGNQLSGFVWPVGEQKPAEPQFTFTDTILNGLPAGKVGVGFDDDQENTTGVYRYVTAQDTPFIDDVGVDGDYDGDDDVDGDDLLIWQNSLGSTTSLAADGDGSSVIDAGDLTVWSSNFGTGDTPAVAAVPEPAALTLAALFAAATARRRKTR